jgi:amino acid transporter
MTDSTQENDPKLGVFLGVFTPTVLTILGVIMFLRVGWVVGTVGLVGTLLIVVIANGITFITTLSMSSLATNMRVGVGGAYYLISRSIGLEAGGAIGIPLYLSQTLSVTLYAYGLAESLRIVWPGAEAYTMPIAVVIIVGVTLFAAKSTELTLKAQVPILVVIVASLAALFFGADWGGSQADLVRTSPEGFWTVFAVFFPAVTGMLAGVSLSGDLKDPGRAIPLGALAAVVLGFVVYLAIPVALYHSVSAEVLRSDKLIWTSVAVGGSWLVIPGMWGAILSSAFGSILGAPRTLQALAKDGLAPEAFGKNDPQTGEPLLGLRVSGALAVVAAICLPGLNLVAEWVTVFFLTTYGALNLVACLEGLVGDPSFRPRIRVNWGWSALGAAGCVIAMLLINPYAGVVAVVLEVVIFWVISRNRLTATWGDARSGILLSGARFVLLRLRDARVDSRNCR